MKPGRKPKPTKLKLIEGNPGHKKLNKKEPKPKSSRPMCPPNVVRIPQARLVWNRTIKLLDDCGLITQLDRDALSCYCIAFATWCEAHDKLHQFGLIVKSPKGYPMQSPYLAIANKAMQQMKDFMAEFGMTPAARSGLQTDSLTPQQELHELLRD